MSFAESSAESQSHERSVEIMQSIPLIRPIIAYACRGIKTPIILSSVCQAFREAVVDYSGAEVAWRALMSSSTNKHNKDDGIVAVSGFLYHAAKHNFPSWIIISLARAGVVYDEELLKKLKITGSKTVSQKSRNVNRRQFAGISSIFPVAGNPLANMEDGHDDNDDDGAQGEQEKNSKANQGMMTCTDMGLELRIDYSEERDDAKNYFHFLAHYGRTDCVKALLELNSADPLKITKPGAKTSLMLAALAKQNSAETIKILLESISDPTARKKFADMKDEFGRSALDWAVSKKNVDAVETLIKVGNANVETRAKADSDRPLHFAAAASDLPVMKCLVKIGNAQPNSKGAFHTTPLLHAVLQEKFEAAKYLIEECGADVTVVDDLGQGALHRAVRNCDAAMVKLLLDNGADPNYKHEKAITFGNLLKEVFAFSEKMKAGKEEIRVMLNIPFERK